MLGGRQRRNTQSSGGLQCPNGRRMKARRDEIAFLPYFNHSYSLLGQSSILASTASPLPTLAVVASTDHQPRAGRLRGDHAADAGVGVGMGGVDALDAPDPAATTA